MKIRSINLFLIFIYINCNVGLCGVDENTPSLTYKLLGSIVGKNISDPGNQLVIKMAINKYPKSITVYSENLTITHIDINFKNSKFEIRNLDIAWEFPFNFDDDIQNVEKKLGRPDSKFIKSQDGG